MDHQLDLGIIDSKSGNPDSDLASVAVDNEIHSPSYTNKAIVTVSFVNNTSQVTRYPSNGFLCPPRGHSR